MANKTNTVPKGLKTVLNKMVASVNKYEECRDKYIANSKTNKVGLYGKNYLAAARKSQEAINDVLTKFANLDVNIAGVPCPIKLGLIVLNCGQNIVGRYSCKAYIKFFERMIKKSKLNG